MRNIIKIVGGLILAFAILAGGLLVLVAAYQYTTDELAAIELPDHWQDSPKISADQEYSLLSWSIGYGSRNSASDNFLEGGKGVRAKNRQTVSNNLEGIYAQIADHDPDLIFLQAIDHDSRRSYYFEQDRILGEALGFGVYSPNHKAYVPRPWPLMGRTDAGLASFSELNVNSAVRKQLRHNYSWPERMYEIKNCLQILHLPVEDQQAELVLINLDLKSYSEENENSSQQLEQLYEIIRSERDQGNYVIAGGNFAHSLLPFSELSFKSGNQYWEPALLDVSAIPEGFELLYGDPDIPGSRLNHMPYDPDSDEMIHFLTDAFIVSDNVEVLSCETFALDFEYSDHNPLLLKFSLD
ncbi:MAG: hypothetical protein PHR37_02745 [Eubacteriales bacterium]|nr:hypothetical protein [Eubacteriales bacterium]